MSGEPSGERPPKPISPVRSDAVAREPHYPGHGVMKGPDFAPEKSPEQVQSFLRQRQSDWDFEDREEMIEDKTERLYQLMIQEGKIAEPDEAEVSDPEYKNTDYNRIGRYVESGRAPEDEKFASDLADIVKRDSQGEWEDSYTIGQPIPKKNPQS